MRRAAVVVAAATAAAAARQVRAAGVLRDAVLQQAPSRALTTGERRVLQRAFDVDDAAAFVRLTGDTNPLHVDAASAAAAGFHLGGDAGAPVLPGMLVASMFPAIIGSAFPGAVYLSQSLKFRRPATPGEPLTASVTVSSLSGSRVLFDTVVTDCNGTVLVDGAALARIPRS
jgi:3-hydroxybutyryl-CoA dehydratase